MRRRLCDPYSRMETDEFRSNNRTFKNRQKRKYDRCHRVRALIPIPDDSDVWITSGDQPISGSDQTHPCPTYVVENPAGQVRRNRQHLNVTPGNRQSTEQPQTEPP